MNKVIVVGNLCQDIELRKTTSNKSVCEFTLAVNETYNGESKAEYIDCQAWEKTAENLSKYLSKGQKVLVEGKIRSSVYEKDGRKIKKTVVLVNNFEFIERRADTSKHTESEQYTQPSAYENRPSNEISLEPDDLPFY